jgi:hypothetical protein
MDLLLVSARVRRAAPVILLVVAALGCTGRPLPLSAQAGGTIVIALGSESWFGDRIGYGGDWLAARGASDDQRGDLVFVLVPPGAPERSLRTLLVTRAYPDPASDAALSNSVDPVLGVGLGQALALLEIPSDTPPGHYHIDVRRQRRTASGGFVPLPALPYGAEIDVLPASVGGVSGRPNRAEAWLDGSDVPVQAQIPAIVPNPKVVLALQPRAPSAAHVELDYPAQKLAIRGVFEEQHTGRRSIVAWRDDPAAGRLSIDLVDPTASVAFLGVAFRLTDPVARGVAQPTDFRVASAVLYDGKGDVTLGSVGVAAIR